MSSTRPAPTIRWLPTLEAACWCAVGVMLAPVVLRVVSPLLPPAAPQVLVPPMENMSRPPAAGGAEVLLGGGGGLEGPPKAADVRLLGWIASGPTASVVISVRDGPQRTLRKGEAAADGLVFHGIDDKAVVLVRGGQQTRIPLFSSDASSGLVMRGAASPSK